jgi:adenosylcobinamide kinase/adenosylcobinamide-phosphate guanylyltransferase
MITFVLGGAKSGKTRWSLRYAEDLTGFKNYYYLATAEAHDEEMQEKIELHKKERSAFWKTIEEPIKISSYLERLKDTSSVILLDCLTLWVSNLIHCRKSFEEEIKIFIEILEKYKGHERDWIILVSNEMGLGIVPEGKLAREFREKAGLLNQKIAEISDEVYFIVAGLPLLLKQNGFTGSMI